MQISIKFLLAAILILDIFGLECSPCLTSSWHVGVAKTAITPTMPVWQAGYDRETKSAGVHDDIWARALALDNGERTVLIVACDLIGLMLPDVDEIRDQLVNPTLPRDNIIITCTHQHSGPDVLGLWNKDKSQSGVDSLYLKELKATIVLTARNALAAKQRAVLAISKTEVHGISYNGRDEGVDDFSVVILRAKSEDGKPIVTLVNFACHPEVLTEENTLITSDYPHYLYQTIESKSGGMAMLISGALGGMLTPLVSANTFEESERCGTTLANAVLAAIAEEKPLNDNTLLSRRQKILLQVANPKFVWLAQQKIIHRDFAGEQVETEVGILQIGPIRAATIPGEALPKVGFAIKPELQTDYPMIFGLANDELGYLIPEADWRPEAYEESMSLGPLAADSIKNEIVKLMKE